MNATPQRERYRALLAGDRCVFPADVFDPISARIAEMLGFEVGMFPGSLASLTVLGDPDMTLITLSEFVDQAHRICRSCRIPVQVEADHGYGNALNVMRTVEELETAGVAALMIQDSDLPRRFGSDDSKGLVSLEEGVGKMRAALRARRDPAFTIAARSSVARAAPAELVARARAYEATGVDALWFSGITTREQLDTLASVTSLPILLGSVPEALADREYLASKRIRVCLQSHAPVRGAVQGLYDTLKALRDGTKPTNIASPELMKRITREADYEEWIREFLGG